MSLKVFGCPGCQQPFQVGPAQAGQVVQCPSCAQTVEIPASSLAPEPPAPAAPVVFQCPVCSGQFGVSSETRGQQVACPHCQSTVQIQLPDSSAVQDPEPSPELQIDVTTPTRKRKSDRKRKSATPSKSSPDLFAPGFTKAPIAQEPTTDPATPKSQAKRKRLKTEKASKKPNASNESQEPHLEIKRRAKSGNAAPPKPSAPKTKAKKEASPAPVRQDQPSANQPNESPDPSKPNAPAEDVAINAQTEQAQAPAEKPPADEGFKPLSVDHLLPPKFDVLDPERLNFQKGSQAHKVLIPDGEGGTAQLDKRVVRVEHGGAHVSLVALTPAQKKRRRTIQNTVTILFAIIVMAVAFSILARQ